MTNNQKVLAWLGKWRDELPAQAVRDLQDIVGSRMTKPQQFHVQQFYTQQIADNAEAEYVSQYHELVNLLLDGDIPSEGILRIEKQLSYQQFEKVLIKASGRGQRLSDLVSSMANDDKYTRGKKSLYLTLNNWLNRD